MTKLFCILFISLLLFPALSLWAQSETDSQEQDSDETAVEKTGGIFPTEVQGEDGNEIEADRETLGNYQKLPETSFTNELRIVSQTQNETRPNYFVLEGYVDITYKGLRLQADHAEYDTVTKDLIAVGNVVVDQVDRRIIGERFEMNLDTKLGAMYNVFGYVPPQVFFWGPKLDKLGEDEYRLHDGVFTECSQIIPHWQLNTTAATMTINEYIRFKGFLLKAKKVPLFYSPFMMWPIKRERATGFLFPGFGPNNTKGFWVGSSFFWAMTRSMDSTFWLDHYQIRGWGGGAEYRYMASEESEGTFKGYFAKDRVMGPEWSIDANVTQSLPADFRLAGVVDVFSSFEYVQDYENSFSRSALRTQRAQGFLTRNWSYYSLNVLGDWADTQFSRAREVLLYHAPEVQFQARSQQLGPTPLFWTLLTSFNELGRGDRIGKRSSSFTFQRYDAFPTVSYPITYLSWLTFTPFFGYRFTYYTKQTDPIKGKVVDQSLLRNYMDLTLDLRGPNFAKIFDTPTFSYSTKWKHAIEPQITYRYIQDIDELNEILRLDEVDNIRGIKLVTYSLTNLLYAKRPLKPPQEYEEDEYQYYNPPPAEEPIESAWEFISWRVQQSYFFDSDSFDIDRFPDLADERFSPITSLLRINPTVNHNVEFRLDYNMKFKQITNMQIGSTLRSEDSWYANVSYVYSNPVSRRGFPGLERRAGNQVRGNAGVGLWTNRLVFSGEADYDITNRKLFRSSLSVLYNDDCFSVGVQWRHYDFGDDSFRRRNENQITFTISLPNIGNLIDYRSGQPPRKF